MVDQTLAFVGGIDLCFGRWDNACHCLVDTDELHESMAPETVEMSVSVLRNETVDKLDLCHYNNMGFLNYRG